MDKKIDYKTYRTLNACVENNDPGPPSRRPTPGGDAIKLAVASMFISVTILWLTVYDGYRKLPVSYIAEYWSHWQAVIKPEVKPAVVLRVVAPPDYVKAAEFHVIRAALLTTYLGPQEFSVQLDKLLNTDWSPDISNAMLLDTLTAVDSKYARFIVRDDKTWVPLLSAVRLAKAELRTLGE